MTDLERILNELAQGTPSTALKWFEDLDRPAQDKVFPVLSYMVGQSHPTSDEISSCFKELKATSTVAVLAKKDLRILYQKASSLDPGSRRQAFGLLLNVLYVADTRRRATYCFAGCTHAWHNIS